QFDQRADVRQDGPAGHDLHRSPPPHRLQRGGRGDERGRRDRHRRRRHGGRGGRHRHQHRDPRPGPDRGRADRGGPGGGGGGAGAGTGGVLGALIGAGIPEANAEAYQDALRNGGVVIGVVPRDSDDANAIQERFRNLRGESVFYG